jgi:O-antigen ligase
VERAVGITSLVGGPNELAGLVLALLPFVAVLFLCTSSMIFRCVLLGIAGLALATVVVTASRISVFALGVMVVYYLLRSRHAIPGFLLLCFAAAITWLVLPSQYKQRYLTVGSYAVGGQLDASNELRIRVWKAGVVMFLEHPIVGVGAGQFPTAYGMSLTRHEAWMNPHNLLLQIACELGIAGLFAFGYFLSRLLKANRYLLSFRDDPDLRVNYQVAVACGAMLIGVLVLSCVSHTLYRPYWYLMGGLVAANCAIAEAIRQKQTVKVEEEEEVASFQWLGRRPARSRQRITRPSWVS